MALTNEQVREILSAAGVDEEHMKEAVGKIISGHLDSVNALRLDVEKYRNDAEKLPGALQELETLKKSSGDVAAVQQQLSELQAKYDADTGASGEARLSWSPRPPPFPSPLKRFWRARATTRIRCRSPF